MICKSIEQARYAAATEHHKSHRIEQRSFKQMKKCFIFLSHFSISPANGEWGASVSFGSIIWCAIYMCVCVCCGQSNGRRRCMWSVHARRWRTSYVSVFSSNIAMLCVIVHTRERTLTSNIIHDTRARSLASHINVTLSSAEILDIFVTNQKQFVF